MPSTSRGYPYPSGSDDVDIPGDIQALADALNTDVGAIAATTPSAPVLQTLADAAGDLAVGSAADTFGRLALGTDNYALTVNTAGAGVAKIGWEDPTANPLTSAALALKVNTATVGNLLTANQASVETDTTGFNNPSSCTLARSSGAARVGTYSLAATATSTSFSFYTPLGTSGVPVTVGQTYTASFWAKAAVNTFGLNVRIRFYNSGGVQVGSEFVSSTVTASASTWTQYLVSAVAPATAAFATLAAASSTCTSGDIVYFDCWGFWEGAGGNWALPGSPITNLGTYVDESVGRRIFTWDAINSRWQMTYGDTGWRAISEWTAGNTGLIGDVTGVALNPTGANSTTEQGGFLPQASNAGGVYLRRINNTVHLRLKSLVCPALSATAGLNIWTSSSVPTGFRTSTGYGTVPISGAPGEAPWHIGAMSAAWMLQCSRVTGSAARTITSAAAAETSWITDVAWPTTLPGTASGSIPS